ncbi:MAG TPA: 50S ribosomal protein L23 [Nitrospirae bacterium]|nr:50S ribosomal protein L23 [bacterium BMS3Abin10]GBE38699.1 50S ribosomal protein L23 [bacterium BMS3Bbin08]HDH00382.1 50S ribosomal protein L23 [Nitrospirota bacterium]HDH51075.1 50S ribosomal protein L23 [Nitrospirota bacterium]HDK41027.1 50S ribosomal protein L23 [Nitrospirota bacterium]
MKTIYDVLLSPLLTEKGTQLKEQDNKVVFRVANDANKIEIKKAVEEAFKVKVERVTTMNCRGKIKRMGKHEGKRPNWKKAIVTLKKGEKLDFIEGV